VSCSQKGRRSARTDLSTLLFLEACSFLTRQLSFTNHPPWLRKADHDPALQLREGLDRFILGHPLGLDPHRTTVVAMAMRLADQIVEASHNPHALLAVPVDLEAEVEIQGVVGLDQRALPLRYRAQR
jgi:hypothetical protein